MVYPILFTAAIFIMFITTVVVHLLVSFSSSKGEQVVCFCVYLVGITAYARAFNFLMGDIL